MKREVRVLFFSILYAYASQCGVGRVSAWEKFVYPPHPHRLDKIQPKSVKKHSKSGRGGAD